MTPKQKSLYWRLWQQAKAKRPDFTDADRHRIHLETLGCDISSNDLTNAHLDKIYAAFLAIAKPGNIEPQLAKIEQPIIRARKAVRLIAAAIDRDDEWLESIIAQANRERRLSATENSTFEDLNAGSLKTLLLIVKTAARREHPTKESLWQHIIVWVLENEVDSDWLIETAQNTLPRHKIANDFDIAALSYDHLLFFLGAAKHSLPDAPKTHDHPSRIPEEIPF
jgi:hypothetical protein